jgi:hypothetical protein
MNNKIMSNNKSREELWNGLDQLEMEISNLRTFVQNDFERCIEDGVYDKNLVKEEMPEDVKENIECIKSMLEEWKNDFYNLVQDL